MARRFLNLDWRAVRPACAGAALFPALVGLAALLLESRARSIAAEPSSPVAPADETNDSVDASFASARTWFLRGDFRQAEQAYRSLMADAPVRAAVGVASCLRATGNDDRAIETLRAAVAERPDAASLHAMLAELAFARGDYLQAEQAAEAALERLPDHLAARWVRTELHRVRGELQPASDGYRWFVRYFNDHDLAEPDDLRFVAMAAAQHARWNRLSDQFAFVVNELLPASRQQEPDYWPSHLEAARLFLEKFNAADAAREIGSGLAINPHAAELHVLRGELALQGFELDQALASAQRAVELNPRLLAAHRLRADIHLANLELDRAVETLSAALPWNLADEETLGRLAVCYAVRDGGAPPADDSRAGKIAAQVLAQNAHAGRFFEACGDACELLRRYPLAAHYYQLAVQRLPQLTAAHGKLGMVLMRLGEEDQARPVLDRAFAADPFNVRVNNTLKVLELLGRYETLETPHFLVRFDPQRDRLTARLVAARLEQVYPELCEQFGYQPAGKSLFELFSKSDGVDGHGWFSARMVGLPRIHTIGACAGRMVAMQSPTDGARRFNWSRVVKHEFVHILNLQQTNFGIPHWYTEALATLAEGYARPPEWDRLLIERHARGKLFTLDDINLGFVRPLNGDDWTMAYCQARLYAEFATERFGGDATARMLSGYADHLDTAATLQRAFGVTQAEFEQGFREYVDRLVPTLPRADRAVERAPRSLAEIRLALETDSRNPDRWAELAEAQRLKRNSAAAIAACEQALAISPAHPAAIAARAKLHQSAGEHEQALALLESAIDESQPALELVRLLASSQLKANRCEEAARWYALGMRHAPGDVKWVKALAAAHLKAGANDRLRPVLEQLARLDADDLAVRQKLVELALAAEDYPAAARHAESCLQIDVLDAESHYALGESLRRLGRLADAASALEASIELRPAKLNYRLARAQTLLAAGERDKAREAARDILNRDPEHSAAKALLESLEP